MIRLGPWFAILGPLVGIAALAFVAWLSREPEPPLPPTDRPGVRVLRGGRDVPFDWRTERAA